MSEQENLLNLQVAGALTQAYRKDSQEFLGYLARILEQALPGHVTAQTTGLFKKSLVGLKVALGEDQLSLSLLPSRELGSTYTKVVRGIALKTETLTIDEWISMLSDGIDEITKRDERSRNALAHLLGLS